MPPTKQDLDASLVFFAFKGRKVAVVRPMTYAEAISLVSQYFRPLNRVPVDNITISAQLPDHQAQGVVEIHPEAWQVALRTVDTFEIGVELSKQPIDLMVNVFRSPSPPLANWVSADPSTSSRTDNEGAPVRMSSDNCPSTNYLSGRGRGRGGGGGGGGGRDRGPVLIGKPVIYLYPTSPIDASVKISLIPQWRFSALYPVPAKGAIRDGKFSRSAEWIVSHQQNGSALI
ncbi:hypothetical protein FRC01_007586 [Tulasnella sp. 417]|nr:hypothetical protein FRC01_007586 [Tulasnella sp. 417]